MSKLIKMGQSAREDLRQGAQIVADVVGTTYGATANNVVVAARLAYPRVLHDGLLVSKDIILDDPFRDAGAQIIKEAAAKTCDGAGDGTTASTILAYAMIERGLAAVEKGANRMKVRLGMNLAKDHILGKLKDFTIPIREGDVKKIATISAQDPEIGEIVATAMEKVGKDGVVHVEDSFGKTITTEFTEGLEFEKGMMTHAFLLQKGGGEVVLEDCLVFVTDHIIGDNNDMMKILSEAEYRGRKLLIIAENIEFQAMNTLIYNLAQNEVQAVAVFAPGYSNQKTNYLDDISLVTGARFVERVKDRLSSVTKDDFGTAKKVVVTDEKTLIIGGGGNVEKIGERLNSLRTQLSSTVEGFKQEQLRERIAKLVGGVAIIKVGAVTDTEAGEKKERVNDAVLACRAAMEEGIVAGGAKTFINLSYALETLKSEDKDVQEGIDVVARALLVPFKVLMDNAGLNFTESFAKVADEPDSGIDVTDGNHKDLVDAGIIDPAKVTRLTIEHATSVAGALITTNAVIVDKPEETKCQMSK
ncbi:MAG: molecular chaperone GroEL [Bacteroidetes bacterium]|nr:MAG: molecular chaperone GroEL [Bacteroidota bacterium]